MMDEHKCICGDECNACMDGGECTCHADEHECKCEGCMKARGETPDSMPQEGQAPESSEPMPM